MSTKIKTIWGDSIIDMGWTPVPNILLRKKKELCLSDDELLFIIYLLSFSDGIIVRDDKIDDYKSSKTMQRRRDSLIEKGYLTVTYKKEYCDVTKRYKTKGMIYNLHGLKKVIDNLSNQQRSKKNDDNEQKTKKSIEKISKDNIREGCFYSSEPVYKRFLELDEKTKKSMLTFFKEYNDFYGNHYILSANDLESDIFLLKKSKYIIDYVKNSPSWNSASVDLIPRYALFEKVPFRKRDLYNYIYENYGQEYSEEEIKELNSINEFYNYLSEKKMTYTELAQLIVKEIDPSLYSRLKGNIMIGGDHKKIMEAIDRIL